jgi:hypothetical protein
LESIRERLYAAMCDDAGGIGHTIAAESVGAAQTFLLHRPRLATASIRSAAMRIGSPRFASEDKVESVR